MKLKDVYEAIKTDEYANVDKSLREKYGKSLNIRDFCEDYKRTSGYAQVKHQGTLKEGFEFTELELAILCDNGFGHFGGSSNIYKRDFTVVIYVD